MTDAPEQARDYKPRPDQSDGRNARYCRKHYLKNRLVILARKRARYRAEREWLLMNSPPDSEDV